MPDYHTLLAMFDKAGIEYELHGGTIEVKSPDFGTTIVFAFSLPTASLHELWAYNDRLDSLNLLN